MPLDPRDYKLDLATATPTAEGSRGAAGAGGIARPFVSVHFECCGAYARIYRNDAATEYRGRCPRCGRPVRFAIGAGGTDARCFRVG